MKILVVVLALVGGLQFIAAQGDPVEPGPDDPTVRDCVIGAAQELGLDGGDTAEWFIDMVQTVDSLLEQRRRCMEMTNDRMRETCLLAFRAQVIVEAFRLRNDLQAIVGDEVSQQFFEAFLTCFGIDPDDPNVTEQPVF